MTIATALDHLTDVLAGEDVAAEQTIEQSVNKIADMIEDGEISLGGGGGGTYTFSIWNVDSTGAMATDGDYATARASLVDAKPVLCTLWYWNYDQTAPHFEAPSILVVELTENSIKLYYSSTAGYEWDADGITEFSD